MFGNMFSSFFGRDCSEIESDPRADMFERELCRNMRQFEESFQEFGHMSPPFEEESLFGRGQLEDHQEGERNDPHSLKDHILSPSPSPSPHQSPFNSEDRIPHFGRRSRLYHEEDKDLDDIVKDDPEQLERILKEPPTPHYEKSDQPLVTRRSQSVTISTIRRPDGSTEQRKTVIDSDGNEETTVTTTPPAGNYSDEDILYNRPSSPSSSYFKRLSDWLWTK